MLGDAEAEPAPVEPKAEKEKPQAKPEAAVAPVAVPQPTAEPALPLPTAAEAPVVAQPQQPAPPATVRIRHDALALPAATAPAPVAAAAPAVEQSEPSVGSISPADAEPAAAALPERAPSAAREGSPALLPAPAPEARAASAAPAEVQLPQALPEPPAESGRAGLILHQLRVQLSPELRSATIQLSPPELGRISIRMRLEKGELHTVVRAERHETLAALQRHVPELKATLEQLGIHARELDLQLGFEQRGPRQDAPAPRDGRPAGAGREHEPELREARLLRTLSAASGGIDTYA